MPKEITLVEKWFEEVWNKGNEAAIDEMMADDGIAHGLVDENGNELRGPAPFKEFCRKFRTDFPDIRIEVEEVLIDGDRSVGRCLVTGTHAASRKPVNFTGMTFIRWRNGQIIEAWNNFDFHVMQQQLS